MLGERPADVSRVARNLCLDEEHEEELERRGRARYCPECDVGYELEGSTLVLYLPDLPPENEGFRLRLRRLPDA